MVPVDHGSFLSSRFRGGRLFRVLLAWIVLVGGALWGVDAIPPRMMTLDNERPLQFGDRLNYQVLEEREEPVALFVDGQGRMNIPLLGRIEAQGRTAFELALEIKYLLEKDYFYQATVILAWRDDTPHRGRVNLIGEVRTNGPQPLPADAAIRVSEMILRSGGFTPSADTSRVTLIRQGGRDASGDRIPEGRSVLDVGRMMETGDFGDDVFLIPEDLILVPKRDEIGGEVIVLGAVNSPGAYPLTREGMTVSRAILSAGGFSRFAQDRRVRLIRSDSDGGSRMTHTINVNRILQQGDRSEDMVVRSGDIIQVDERVINF